MTPEGTSDVGPFQHAARGPRLLLQRGLPARNLMPCQALFSHVPGLLLRPLLTESPRQSAMIVQQRAAA